MIKRNYFYNTKMLECLLANVMIKSVCVCVCGNISSKRLNISGNLQTAAFVAAVIVSI